MTIKTDGIAKVVTAAVGSIDLNQAMAIASELLSLIQMVEDLADGLKGSDKLAAVREALASFVNELNPAIGQVFDRLWAFLKPVVNIIVAIYHVAGIFQKKPA